MASSEGNASSADHTDDQARFGWGSSFPQFHGTPAVVVQGRLEQFIRDAGDAQKHAWAESVPALQREVGEVIRADAGAPSYAAILEYELPLESRRTDVILLARGAVVVLELKGKTIPSQADLDQAAACLPARSSPLTVSAHHVSRRQTGTGRD